MEQSVACRFLLSVLLMTSEVLIREQQTLSKTYGLANFQERCRLKSAYYQITICAKDTSTYPGVR